MHDSLKLKNNSGFTLIEIALALLILAVFGLGAIFIYNSAEDQRRQFKTEERMRIVTEALARYVETANRIPCPANPSVTDDTFGWEWDAAAPDFDDGHPIPNLTCRQWGAPQGVPSALPGVDGRNIGIVPFLALGLQDKDVRDAWGRYFTYAVSPVFAQNPDDIDITADPTTSAADDTGEVHIRCADKAWLDGQDAINATKAKFCCTAGGHQAPFRNDGADGAGDPGEDIEIFVRGKAHWPEPDPEIYNNMRNSGWNNVLPGNLQDFVPVDPGFDIDQPDEGIDTDFPYVSYSAVIDRADKRDSRISNNFNFAAPAFFLVSYGRDGNGAFLADGTFNKYSRGADDPPNNAEIQNGADNSAEAWNHDFFISRYDERTFDQIILWRTQDGIMAETGSSSCAYP